MKTKSTVTMGILVAGLFIASVVFAKGGTADTKSKLGTNSVAGEEQTRGELEIHPREGQMGRGGRGNRMHHRRIRGLNLSESQRAKLDKIDATSQKIAAPIHHEMDGLRDKMHKEWRANKPNKNNIMSLHRKMRGLNDKLAERRISDRLDRIALLTPEQRAEMIERMPEKRMRDGRGFKDGRGRGKGHGPKDGRGRGRGKGYGPKDGRGPGACDGSGNGRSQGNKAPAPKTNK